MEAELTLAYNHNCPVCAQNKHPEITLALSITDKELEKWVKEIHKKGVDAGLHIPSVQAFANKYWDAVQSGYGSNFQDIDFDTPDADMLKHLAENVYSFSMAKNHSELKAITSKLVDDKGKVRSWEQFRKEAATVTGTFRGSWLEAEYEQAVAGGQMASKWVEFERTGDNTLLRYSTVKDSRVSDICRPLEGVQKPLNDKFWLTHYPPNHFRCRCDVDRLTSGTITDDKNISLPKIPKMLRVNLAKEKLVFPPSHPYWNNTKKIKETSSEASTLFAYEHRYGITVDKELFEYLKAPVTFTNKPARGATYTPGIKIVNVPYDARRANSKWKAESVIYHEYGHAADDQHNLRNNILIKDLMEKYRKEFKKNQNELYIQYDSDLKKIYRDAIKKNDHTTAEQSLAALDTLMSLNPKFGLGHSVSYFNRKGMKEAEFIAHTFENKFIENPVFKKTMPDLYKEMKLTLEKVKKEINQ